VDQIDSPGLKKVRKNAREHLRINDSIGIIIVVAQLFYYV